LQPRVQKVDPVGQQGVLGGRHAGLGAQQLVGQSGGRGGRALLRAGGGWGSECIERILHRQVGELDLALLDAVVLRQHPQLTDFPANRLHRQVLGFHRGPPLTLERDQAGSVVVPFRHPDQGERVIED